MFIVWRFWRLISISAIFANACISGHISITYAQQNAANAEKHGLNCTDLCSCSDKGKLCNNMQDNDGDDDGGDEEEDFYD